MRAALIVLGLALAAAGPARALLPPQAYLAARAEAPRWIQMEVTRVTPPAGALGDCVAEGMVARVFRGPGAIGDPVRVTLACRSEGARPPPGPRLWRATREVLAARYLEAFVAGEAALRDQAAPIAAPTARPLCALTAPTCAEAAAPVTLEDAAWLAGRWTGPGLGGQTEEVWSPPAGGRMIGHFQLIRDGALVFFEAMMIEPRDGGLTLRVKHFNPDFTGWEEKDRSVDFAFESAAPGMLRFRSLRFEAKGPDRLDVTLTLRQPDGRRTQELFRLVRAP